MYIEGILLSLLIGQGNPDMVDSLRRVSPKSPHYTSARSQLADHFLSKQSVVGRRRAMETIDDALRFQKSNLALHAMKVRILFEQGFYRRCDQAAQELLTIRPSVGQSFNEPFAEAYYFRGLVAERSALKYQNMVSFVESNILHLSSYGTQDMLRAAQFYEQAIVYNASHRDAIFHLAMLYFEIKSYDKMAFFFEKLSGRDSSDAEVCCFAAFANYQAGRFDKSSLYYDRALALMDSGTRSLYENIRPITAKSNEHRVDDAVYKATFWNEKDPLLLTDFNERRLEHYNRLTYANLRFGVPKLNKAGWQTDRGVVFLKYGEPLLRYKTQPDEKMLGGQEIWVYPEYTFRFDDEYASGHFVMDQPSYLAYRSATNTIEDSYSLPTDHTFILSAEAFQFKGTEGRTKIRAYMSAPADHVDPTFNETGYPVRIHQGLFVLNQKSQSLVQKRSVKDFSVDHMNDVTFADHLEIEVEPRNADRVTVVMEWLTEGDQRFGTARQPLEIRKFDDGNLSLSDLVVGVKDQWSPFRCTKKVGAIDDVQLYFEFYNLTLDDNHTASYIITVSLARQRRGGIASFVQPGRSEIVLKSVFENECRARDESYALGLNFRDIEPGKYTLEIEVIDRLTLRSATSSTEVHILQPGTFPGQK